MPMLTVALRESSPRRGLWFMVRGTVEWNLECKESVSGKCALRKGRAHFPGV